MTNPDDPGETLPGKRLIEILKPDLVFDEIVRGGRDGITLLYEGEVVYSGDIRVTIAEIIRLRDLDTDEGGEVQ